MFQNFSTQKVCLRQTDLESESPLEITFFRTRCKIWFLFDDTKAQNYVTRYETS